MKTLVSPNELGELVCKGFFAHIPVVRELVYGTVWQRYYMSIWRQIVARGQVPDDVWISSERCATARTIERVLDESYWGGDFTFHPDDPYFIVGGWEVSDLSEIEAIMEIEERLEVRIDRAVVFDFVEKRTTFDTFVDYIISLRQGTAPDRVAPGVEEKRA